MWQGPNWVSMWFTEASHGEGLEVCSVLYSQHFSARHIQITDMLRRSQIVGEPTSYKPSASTVCLLFSFPFSLGVDNTRSSLRRTRLLYQGLPSGSVGFSVWLIKHWRFYENAHNQPSLPKWHEYNLGRCRTWEPVIAVGAIFICMCTD